jgi:hypothetical protein
VTELPRILIAKYIPDVFRDEPRNIGVVLWTPDAVAARFLGEKPDAPGEVNDSEIPAFVHSPHAYKQWVRYWRRGIDKLLGGGADRLDSLRRTGPSNYHLADAGVIAEPIPRTELPQAVQKLFESHVAPQPPAEQGPGKQAGGGASQLAALTVEAASKLLTSGVVQGFLLNAARRVRGLMTPPKPGEAEGAEPSAEGDRPKATAEGQALAILSASLHGEK